MEEIFSTIRRQGFKDLEGRSKVEIDALFGLFRELRCFETMNKWFKIEYK